MPRTNNNAQGMQTTSLCQLRRAVVADDHQKLEERGVNEQT